MSTLSVTRMRIQCPEGFDEAFMAKPFEGFGDVWNALFGDSKIILSYLPNITSEGKTRNEWIVKTDDKQIVLLQYPDYKLIRLGLLIEEKPDNYEVIDYYPILEGVRNKLRIIKSHIWENKIEGVVTARSLNDDELPISFFAPYFFRDSKAFAPNTTMDICLAGLAYSCEKATQDGVEITEGPLYEDQLEKFLKEHPSKNKEDFPSAFVSFKGSTIFVPKTYIPNFEFRCPVLDVKKTSFLKQKIYQLYMPIIGYEDTATFCNLYVPEHLLNGYEPKEGDDIQGVFWTNGYIA